MADILADRFRRWFVYERDAHAKAFASLEAVPAVGRGDREYRKAVSLMAHLVAARQTWLHRLGVGPAPTRPLFDEADAALPDVAAEWAAAADRWDAYLAGLADADLAKEFEYRSFDGSRFRNTVEEVLTQLFGHSWYHRGQVAVLVRAAGGTPAITDLIFWCRQPVGG